MKWTGIGWSGSMAEKFAQKVFVLNDIIFVPHYLNQGIFVSPGGKQWIAAQLKEMGATESIRMLWKRPYYQGE
jgi:hypothetical protein